MNRKFKRTVFVRNIEIFCNIINVYTVIFVRVEK